MSWDILGDILGDILPPPSPAPRHLTDILGDILLATPQEASADILGTFWGDPEILGYSMSCTL